MVATHHHSKEVLSFTQSVSSSDPTLLRTTLVICQCFTDDEKSTHHLKRVVLDIEKMGKRNKKHSNEAKAKKAALIPPKTAGDESSATKGSRPNKAMNHALPIAGSFRTIEPPLSQGVLDFLDRKHFRTMTPVQEATIPLFLQNKDVAVQAVTGSGKTLAFLIPVVERIQNKKFTRNQIGSLILSPTRELAMQTWRVCREICECMKMTPPLLLVGGGGSGNNNANHRPVTEDLKTFQKEGSDIIIGTPGRMDDVLSRYSVIDVSELDILILDEADALLFGKSVMDPTIAAILSKLPKMRRTGIFSATTTFTTNKNIKPLLQRAGMRNPVLINVQVAAKIDKSKLPASVEEGENAAGNPSKNDSTYTPTTLTNYYLVTRLEEKISRLVAFLRSHQDEKIIVFFLTCACVDFYGNTLQQLLKDQGVCLELLHGKMVQKRREKSMDRFRETDTGIALFCTDVAARGLDVDNVDWVVQVDAPQDPSQFVHRVGRSARAGRKGASLVFLTEKEEAYVDLLSNRQVYLQELSPLDVCCRAIKPIDSGKTDTVAVEYIEDILPAIRGLVLKDRDILEKGTKAFTSYIRAYKEHLCAFIFRFASLDLGLLATSFCLLRLPKMPELREGKGKLENFKSAGPEVNIFAIPYLDKARENARQKRLKEELAAGGKNAKQIKAEQRKAEQLQQQQQRRQQAIAKGRNPDKKRGRHQQIVDEWDDLAKEERLYKKLRRGKISKNQYETLIRGGSKNAASSDKADDSESSSENSE